MRERYYDIMLAMASRPNPINELAGAFVLLNNDGSKTFSHTGGQIDNLFYDIRDMFKHAISATLQRLCLNRTCARMGATRRGRSTGFGGSTFWILVEIGVALASICIRRVQSEVCG
jgi:hypothetical protein